jgi:hypothetical protein
MSNDRYNELIDSMAREIDHNGEYPNKYSNEFVECASESLRKEVDTIHIKGLLVFDAIIKGDKKDGRLLEMIAKYMKEESDVLKKVIAIAICELITDNVINFYEEDISDDVKKTYSRKYCEDNRNYSVYNSNEQLPHCG